jgi:hypothetical protein
MREIKVMAQTEDEIITLEEASRRATNGDRDALEKLVRSLQSNI